tara:strand:- start:424 stop:615 length:192 start_codon:yes stop_codon:yes gene_type:complete
MAKIECKLCNADTGYTDSTPVEDRTRSIAIGEGDSAPKGETCFCSDCWSTKNIGSLIGDLRSS